jgi:hypothetical protein
VGDFFAMNSFTIAINFLVLAAFFISPLARADTPPCRSGNTKNTAYMLRPDDSRCEGIVDPEAARSDFNLSSFTVGMLQPADKLVLRIPKSGDLSKPDVFVQSSVRYYRLKPLILSSLSDRWQFQWSSSVLRQVNIVPTSLRSIARAGDTILPVLLSRSPVYTIYIYTGGHVKTITLHISQSNGKQIYSQTLTDRPGDEVSFTWNGRTQKGDLATTGHYILKVEAQVEQRNAPSESRTYTVQFEHNPAWLN